MSGLEAEVATARALIGQRVSVVTWPGMTGELKSVSNRGLAFLVNVSVATPGGEWTHSCACSNVRAT